MPDVTPANPRDVALEFLYGRIDYERGLAVPYREREFKLDRMYELLDRLGNPQRTLKTVHIAGTKGKGSTAAMISAVLSAAGLKTGRFTSPHLHRLEERLAIDGQSCSSDELVALVDRVRPVVLAMDRSDPSGPATPSGPTYFEVTTAMAFVYFVDRGVDLAVVEVGLGGRLDSTNVCQPIVSVITSISFDHMQQLGHTLAAIAREKAGIIKEGVSVVSGARQAEPHAEISEVCRQRGSPLWQIGVDFDFDYTPPQSLQATGGTGKIDFRFISGEAAKGRPAALQKMPLGLLGLHQGANAAVAIATIEQLRRQGFRVRDAALRRGLETAECPARVELVARHPAVVIDAAHNVASVAALLDALRASFSARRRILVFASTQEKDLRGMLALLLEEFDHIVFTRYANNPRAVDPAELAAIAAAWIDSSDSPETAPSCCVREEISAAWEEVRRVAQVDDLVCVTGSFFIAAEMRMHAAAHPLAETGLFS